MGSLDATASCGFVNEMTILGVAFLDLFDGSELINGSNRRYRAGIMIQPTAPESCSTSATRFGKSLWINYRHGERYASEEERISGSSRT
jgi:hypothetical protein